MICLVVFTSATQPTENLQPHESLGPLVKKLFESLPRRQEEGFFSVSPLVCIHIGVPELPLPLSTSQKVHASNACHIESYFWD